MKTRALLIRGLWGLFWSRGMDKLARKLRAAGIETSVHSKGLFGYSGVPAIAEAALSAAKAGSKIILGGHSMGADAAVMVAERLGEKRIEIPLVACFDPTTFGCPPVPANVTRALNFYQKRSALGRGTLAPGRGFKGTIEQRQVDDIHVRIDDDPELHARVLAEAKALLTTNAKAPR
jgi:pimeloyl-ACP methyl ester carboxylesterase